ncbi:MAG: hypothetical protein AAF752_15745 [Bacteroidota bacterium]
MKKYRTEMIFTVAAVLGIVGVALLFSSMSNFIRLPVLVLGFGVIVWALVKSDKEGFIKITRMPRAGDPQREFHPVQSFILVGIAIAQFTIGAYKMLTMPL